MMLKTSKLLAALAVLALPCGVAHADVTLKAVMHSDVKIVDPIWTTAYITRNHGYMVYDTLFAMDAQGEIKPQMVDKYDVSAHKLTYTFTLRNGLLWHDGKPVTAEDCIASIKRWAAKDSLGQKVMGFVDTITAADAKSFTIKLKEQTGLLIFALGKPSSNVPFMMPKRVADTDPNTQISDFTGSAPFNNPKIRQALWYAFNQKDFLDAVIGDPTYYKTCKSEFPCGTAMSTDAGMGGLLESNFQKSKDLLKEAGYDGTPVVLMHSTDLQVLTNLAPVAKSLMEKGGFKVDMQSMDWQTLVARRAKKEPPSAGGWNAFMTSWVSADILNPVMAGFANAGCDKAMFGWPCDEVTEKLRDQFARETDPAKQKEIAAAVQKRNTEFTTHLFLGQWYLPAATRKNIDGIPTAPVPVFWNVEKKSQS